jgi:hypothetical protein
LVEAAARMSAILRHSGRALLQRAAMYAGRAGERQAFVLPGGGTSAQLQQAAAMSQARPLRRTRRRSVRGQRPTPSSALPGPSCESLQVACTGQRPRAKWRALPPAWAPCSWAGLLASASATPTWWERAGGGGGGSPKCGSG